MYVVKIVWSCTTKRYINYFSFTSSDYTFGLVRTLVDRVYKINSSWSSQGPQEPYPHFAQKCFPYKYHKKDRQSIPCQETEPCRAHRYAQEQQSVSTTSLLSGITTPEEGWGIITPWLERFVISFLCSQEKMR